MDTSNKDLDNLVLLINNCLSEKERRILLSAAAKVYGHGGKQRIKDLTGVAFSTLHRGLNDVSEELLKPGRKRRTYNRKQLNPVSDEEHEAKAVEKAPETTAETSGQSLICFSSAESSDAKKTSMFQQTMPASAVADAEEIDKKAQNQTKNKFNDPTKTKAGKDRQRKAGAGRPSVLDIYPDLPEHIDALINWRAPTYGSPMGGPIRIDKAMSEKKIAEELLAKWNVRISSVALHYLLPQLGYSKMVNQKEKQVGAKSPWRNNQFLYIAEQSKEFLDAGEPVISIDTKKKEKVGEFKNNGKEWCLKGLPREVLDHDFLIKELGQVAPYGVYVVNDNTGFINLGLAIELLLNMRPPGYKKLSIKL